MDKVELVIDAQNHLGEGPVWNDAEQALYWVDCLGSRLFALSPESGARREWDLGEYPGSYAFRAGGSGVIMAFRRGLALVELGDDGRVKVDRIDDPMVDLDRGRFNDGACDRAGRFWTGQMDRKLTDPVGFLYRVDPDRSVHRMDGGIASSNGIAFSPDNRTMYYTDSKPATVYAYDFDLDAGINRNKRIFLDLSKGPSRPDGCTIDAEGCLWVAEVEGGRIGRYRPDGSLDRHIALPVPKPSSVMFGGKDLDTLYVTTMWMGLSAEERQAHPLSGALFAIRPGVSGLPEPRFAG